MGFGTLFIGYFLLLNIFNYAYTDLIAGLIMLLGAYKLSAVSPEFKKGFWILIPYSALGAYEIVAEIINMFKLTSENPIITGTIGILRCALLGLASFFILSGIKNLALELELWRLRDKAKSSKISVITAYGIALILEIPALDKLIPTEALAVIALLSLVFSFAVTVYVLTAIYSAYMHICMPEDIIREENRSREAIKKQNRKKG
ncbi:MAG: hypothetical protein IJW38_01285 [Clostridia bacterium]|nr:hypothetical protein [Clostridia bacterium]